MREIFRKTNLDKISSPEQLDKLVPITTISSWLVLLGMILLVVFCIVWLFEGSIYTEKEVSGIYIDNSKIYNMYSDNSGMVDKVNITIDDFINVNDTIAIVDGKAIKSCYSGIINKVSIHKGEVLDSSKIIAEIRSFDKERKNNFIRCYVPLELSKSLKDGMQTIIVPSNLNEEQYGHMSGRISSIGGYILSDADMYSVLGNNSLVNKFKKLNNNEPLVEVIVSIDTDKSTLSGYKWSNKKGKDIGIKDFTMVDIQFNISKNTPFKMLFSN